MRPINTIGENLVIFSMSTMSLWLVELRFNGCCDPFFYVNLFVWVSAPIMDIRVIKFCFCELFKSMLRIQAINWWMSIANMTIRPFSIKTGLDWRIRLGGCLVLASISIGLPLPIKISVFCSLTDRQTYKIFIA